MSGKLLRRIQVEGISDSRARGRDLESEEGAARIIADVALRGARAVREWSEKMGELEAGESLVLGRGDLEAALARLDRRQRGVLERAVERVTAFAAAQRAALVDLDVAVPGGRAGHTFVPVSRAGCYVPGGRFPLPSSAVMTVCAARAAGVQTVWCAGPKPALPTLAAAALAGADGFLAAGGAQGIAALAYGAGVPACDVIVGPGGRYPAAAKRLLFGIVGTEAPAGPSELLVIAGAGADAETAAADLLAQAEHDVAATPAVVSLDPTFSAELDEALERRLADLPEPNRSTAAAALSKGWMIEARSREEAVAAADRFAPEHLELLVEDPRSWAASIRNAGAIFLGSGSAEVFGDYGAGPNHCLPTGGAARFAAGLSVLAFLRARTWLEMDSPEELAGEAAALARIEGLEAHARAAERRGSRAPD